MAARSKGLRGNKHWEALRTSSFLTQTFNRMYRPMAARITPEMVIETLNGAGVHFVLMGTHGVGSWRSRSRATDDVDVLVTKKDHAKAVRAIRERFPKLEVKDFPVVTRFLDPKTQVGLIDLMKPTQEVFRIAFRQTIEIGDSHRIPNLEMSLVSKFAAMVSPHRKKDKKLIDGGDFYNIAQHHLEEIDLTKLKNLADKVYPDGGSEILRLIEAIKDGKDITF